MNRLTSQPEIPLNSFNLAFIEELYVSYLRDPSSVPPDWRRYFEQFSQDDSIDETRLGPSFRPTSFFNPAGRADGVRPGDAQLAKLQNRVDLLIRNFRVRGHLIARLDPLDRPRPHLPELDPKFYGFTEADMERRFSSETLHRDGPLTLREILDCLRNTYCRSIGVQFMHIDDLSTRRWLQERMEGTENRLKLGRDEQIRILTRLTDAVIFEEFIRKKFIGAKSFSLEGGESLIPLLELAIERGAEEGLDEIVLAMAHRGRLNVLANIIGKSPREIFREFEDSDPELYLGRGDVKYHLGYSNDWRTASGRKVHLSLCFNPSHLEFVNPVAVGRMRAKQDRVGDRERKRGMVLLIHGDASFAGEGGIQETLNLSQLDGYTVGGTLHVIVNNQIGFTTSPSEYSSPPYTTDVAKMLQSPIFHVNGEDPEAVARVVQLSMDFRRTFKRDVVIDMYCYRRLGHNEGDEPTFTQPVLYRAIERRKPVREGYLEHLLALGEVTREEADGIAARRREHLEKELSEARKEEYVPHPQTLSGVWEGYHGGPESAVIEVETGVAQERLSSLLQVQTHLPEGFHSHPKIERGIRLRREMAEGKRPLDWSAAEALAFASLATEGVRVRLTGRTRRAAPLASAMLCCTISKMVSSTFLSNIYPGIRRPWRFIIARFQSWPPSASVWIQSGLPGWIDTLGGSVRRLHNAAQVIVDQFIASAEDKWRRLSGLVLLLPHGFEGMGPSTQRAPGALPADRRRGQHPNRSPTTPAQYFHCLRRQALRRWRKPLVVMTPKSLLRHPRVASTLEECARGAFQRILPDSLGIRGERAKRVILCSGKIYYELEQRREKLQRNDVAILRVEQLYPLPQKMLGSFLAGCPEETPTLWVQEEPENMGAWHYLKVSCGETLFDRFPFSVIARPQSASPATGSASSHKQEQEQLLTAAFGGS
jgi:2-oxoglutarate dehydrogenase E1 component